MRITRTAAVCELVTKGTGAYSRVRGSGTINGTSADGVHATITSTGKITG